MLERRALALGSLRESCVLRVNGDVYSSIIVIRDSPPSGCHATGALHDIPKDGCEGD